MTDPQISIMQPYFFPYIGYWQMLASSDVFVIYDDGLFRKDGWINRNRILGSGAESTQLITLPVHAKSRNRLIDATEVGRDARYDRTMAKFVRTLEMRYGKAPYFGPAMEVLLPLLACEERLLVPYLVTGIRGVMRYLGIDTKLVLSSEINKTGLDGVVEKVVRICQVLGSRNYVNACGGVDLYDREDFRSRGLDLRFIRRLPSLSYRQFGGAFVPDLSIIDVMMFNSPEEIGGLLKQYELF